MGGAGISLIETNAHNAETVLLVRTCVLSKQFLGHFQKHYPFTTSCFKNVSEKREMCVSMDETQVGMSLGCAFACK